MLNLFNQDPIHVSELICETLDSAWAHKHQRLQDIMQISIQLRDD